MSVSTNVLTGAHSACLFVVVAWFIYRLKDEAKLVVWMLLKWVWVVRKWELVSWKLVEVLREWRDVLFKSDRSLHFRRNVCW